MFDPFVSELPATTFPWRFNSNGLPIGFQAMGPYLEDHTAIGFVALLEQEYGGFVPPLAYQA